VSAVRDELRSDERRERREPRRAHAQADERVHVGRAAHERPESGQHDAAARSEHDASGQRDGQPGGPVELDCRDRRQAEPEGERQIAAHAPALVALGFDLERDSSASRVCASPPVSGTR
jgi:hypothetical protein